MKASDDAKNMEKYYSYKLAFERIDLAIKNKFPLEAIVIEESIISDRLRSYCETSELGERFEGFCDLLQRASEYAFVNCDELYNLIGFIKDPDNSSKDASESIDQWRLERNRLVHKIVKTSKSGLAPEIPANEFIDRAVEIAKYGKEHARKICNISSKLQYQRKKLLKQQKDDSDKG